MSVEARHVPKRSLTSQEDKRKEQVLTQPTPSKVRESTTAIVLKEDEVFLLTDPRGDVPAGREHALGLFYRDCRFLDRYELRVEARPPVVLSASSWRGFETRHNLANPDLPDLERNTVGIRRQRLVRDASVYEVVTLRNFGAKATTIDLSLMFGSRFEDIFTLRGFVPKGGRHEVLEPSVDSHDRVRLRASGRDGEERVTTLAFTPPPDSLSGSKARFALSLANGEERHVAVTITPRVAPAREARANGSGHFDPADISSWLDRAARDWLGSWTEVRSSNALFDAVIRRALLDLRLLRTSLDSHRFIAAGIPWFATLFGRDSAIVGLQMLAFGTSVAKDTLELLARFQATKEDAFRDAEPGKILHELRRGELARAALIPQSPAYYGTVDATLLFLILLAEYVDWSGDQDFARRLLPNVRAAIAWTLDHADHDGDGFLDYDGKYRQGLVNQGWKDSGVAIMNVDGSLAEPPIALAEVQSYAFRAWRSTAKVLRRLGGHSEADRLDSRAEEMRRLFEDRFWSEKLGCYVMALQKDGRPCAVPSSNAGQVLWGGIASDARARRVASRLLEPDLFSGWGIRTLGAKTKAYNPIGYHLGSVWPHDNSMILAGLRRYGCDNEAETVFAALVDAAAGMRDYRMPELYCGYRRQNDELAPVMYPVACSPQAWAAGALPYGLRFLLGLDADAGAHLLRVTRPHLPRQVDWLELRGVRVGEASATLRFRRENGTVRCDATVLHGDLSVEIA